MILHIALAVLGILLLLGAGMLVFFIMWFKKLEKM